MNTSQSIDGARKLTAQQADVLLRAAKRWASFQEGDSLNDQQFDERLKAEAAEAREALLAIIENIP